LYYLQKLLNSLSAATTHFKSLCFVSQTKVYLNSHLEIDMETATGSVFCSDERFLSNHPSIRPCVYRLDFECRGKLQYIAKLQSEWSDGRVTAGWNVLPPELTSAGHSCLVSAVMERNRGESDTRSGTILERESRDVEKEEKKINDREKVRKMPKEERK
jgi:hypothetical protein